MTGLTRDVVVRVLGSVDDLAIARVVATGATASELEEAAGEVEIEVQEGQQAPEASTPRVAELRAILLELFDDEIAEREELA